MTNWWDDTADRITAPEYPMVVNLMTTTDGKRTALLQDIDERQRYFEGLAERHEKLRLMVREEGSTMEFIELVNALGSVIEDETREAVGVASYFIGIGSGAWS